MKNTFHVYVRLSSMSEKFKNNFLSRHEGGNQDKSRYCLILLAKTETSVYCTALNTLRHYEDSRMWRAVLLLS